MAATLFIGKAISDNPDASMMIVGGGFFLISYLMAKRITPPPNDNIWFLLGPGHYVDAATGEANDRQMRELSHSETVGDKFHNALDDMFGREKPVLRTDPTTNTLKYYINGKYYTIEEVQKDIDTQSIPEAWGSDVDIKALRDEIARTHLDVNGSPIISPTEIPRGTNVSSYNNASKAAALNNTGTLMGSGAKEFVADHKDLIAQAYPGREEASLTDDDIVHVYNQIYVGAADRRGNTAGEATRVDIAKWVNLKHQNVSRLGNYEAAIIRNNLKWKEAIDKGEFDNREGYQNQIAHKTSAAVTSVPISNKKKGSK